jgi:hypothetical protein
MGPAEWIGVPVLGKLPPGQLAEKLRQVGEVRDAEAVERVAGATAKASFLPASWWPFSDRPWQHVSHAIGFVADTAAGGASLPIHDAGTVAPDASLKGGRVKITLDALWAAGYPGGGEHNVLCDFYAQSQSPDGTEHLHFSMNLRVRNAEFAGVRGRPIFVGLQVGKEGLDFKCFTVNVANADDEKFLTFLDSDTFRGGLKLVSSLQPATALFSATALALTRQIAARHRNVPVQDFCLGLDFSGKPARAALAEGTYIALQAPESSTHPWKWDDLVCLPGRQVVAKADGTTTPPYNYLLFTVTRYVGD